MAEFFIFDKPLSLLQMPEDITLIKPQLKQYPIFALTFLFISSVSLTMAQTTTTIIKDTNKNIIREHITDVTTEIDNSPENFDAFETYKRKNLRHVPNAHGTVMVSFKTETDGSITNIKINKGLNKAADAEALRLMKASPKWKPNTQEGEPISSTYILPITFK